MPPDHGEVSVMVTAVAFSALLILTVAASRVITRLCSQHTESTGLHPYAVRHPTDREKHPGQAVAEPASSAAPRGRRPPEPLPTSQGLPHTDGHGPTPPASFTHRLPRWCCSRRYIATDAERPAIMATLRERKNYRQAIMKMLYEATEGNRLLGVTGARLRDDLQVPEQDLAAACAYLVGEELITVDWTQGNTPAMVMLTHRGIRLMEAEEEERG